MIEAYVDGSFGKNSKGCEIPSWAFIVLNEEDKEIEYEEYGTDIPQIYYEHRNVAGEVYAVIKLIEFCVENEEREVLIHNDYEGLSKWATGAWKTNKELTKKYKEFLDNSGVLIKWEKVDAHTGQKWNEYADSLCKQAIDEDETEISLNEIPVEIFEPPAEITYNTNPPSNQTIRSNPNKNIIPNPKKSNIHSPVLSESNLPTGGTGLSDSLGQEKTLEADFEKILKEAEELCSKNKFMEASQVLKPYINKNSDEKVFKAYIDIILYLGDFYAKKAVTFCEAYIPFHPGTRVRKSYCYALFYAYIRPITSIPLFDLSKYNEAKGAALKILQISKREIIINEFMYPLIEYSYRIGDKGFIKSLLKEFDINLFSKEKVRVGRRVLYSNYERVSFMIRNLDSTN